MIRRLRRLVRILWRIIRGS
ncbi:Protein of unknown function [Pyronema omphalodes CBS 100304]|uniref:Uncharacterized protein n=1 Tax=Pyronema omphalodes (strain CBS 100304) TaxID=1076935 RepID=U4L4V2_PYROM|nr:Protein of unknown function [Pyronema omphalodes CBS 100304]